MHEEIIFKGQTQYTPYSDTAYKGQIRYTVIYNMYYVKDFLPPLFIYFVARGSTVPSLTVPSLTVAKTIRLPLGARRVSLQPAVDIQPRPHPSVTSQATPVSKYVTYLSSSSTHSCTLGGDMQY